MLTKEWIVRANILLKEIKFVLGDGFHIPDFMGKGGHDHTLVTHIDFQESDEVCVNRNEIRRKTKIAGVMQARIVAELKKKIVKLESAVQRLEV